ncbi:hypothetical protein BGZ93_006005 [Podila epicladia]|nr:hypothetical protein BGZ92_002832 [Podila epicladia]KAG0099786.1 hypothetical protein BGZ93_006005 [Podila epicladia]
MAGPACTSKFAIFGGAPVPPNNSVLRHYGGERFNKLVQSQSKESSRALNRYTTKLLEPLVEEKHRLFDYARLNKKLGAPNLRAAMVGQETEQDPKRNEAIPSYARGNKRPLSNSSTVTGNKNALPAKAKRVRHKKNQTVAEGEEKIAGICLGGETDSNGQATSIGQDESIDLFTAGQILFKDAPAEFQGAWVTVRDYIMTIAQNVRRS